MCTMNGAFALILMLVGVAMTLELPNTASDNSGANPAKDTVHDDTVQGRFLEPAYFGVRSKKFSIGTNGVAPFFRAWRYCIEEGKSLATIESKEEQEAVEQLIANHHPQYWIAGTNLGSSHPSRLTWITSDLPPEYVPKHFQPVKDTCVSVNRRGKWENNVCMDDDLKYAYLCEDYY